MFRNHKHGFSRAKILFQESSTTPVPHIHVLDCCIFRSVAQDLDLEVSSPVAMQPNFDHITPLKTTPAVSVFFLSLLLLPLRGLVTVNALFVRLVLKFGHWFHAQGQKILSWARLTSVDEGRTGQQ